MINEHKSGNMDVSRLLGISLLIVFLIGTVFTFYYQSGFSGLLHGVVQWVSVGTFAYYLKKAYDLYRAGRTIAAAVAAVGSPALSLAVYILGQWVISAVAYYGISVVAGW